MIAAYVCVCVRVRGKVRYRSRRVPVCIDQTYINMYMPRGGKKAKASNRQILVSRRRRTHTHICWQRKRKFRTHKHTHTHTTKHGRTIQLILQPHLLWARARGCVFSLRKIILRVELFYNIITHTHTQTHIRGIHSTQHASHTHTHTLLYNP